MNLHDMDEPAIYRLLDDAFSRAIESLKAAGIDKPQVTMLVWNDHHLCQYASNCERASMITAIQETVVRLSLGQDVTR